MLETCTLTKTGERGSLPIVLLLCEDNHDTCRYSQPLLQENLSMTSSILLHGNTFQRLKEIMNIADISLFSDTTYNSLQDQYIFPAVNNIYNTHKGSIILRVPEEDFNVIHVALAGDFAKMELAGVKFMLTSLEFRIVTISSLRTDLHQQVRAYLEKKG